MLLTNAKVGEEVKVVELYSHGLLRNRMLDLGILPGTKIMVRRKSPLGDPIAYEIRETIIALRSEETDLIEVI